MRIFIMGQCTLHWGRLEFGNLGNYAIIEPLVHELHRVFPNSEIKTTFQMTDDFCERMRSKNLPMHLYYGWRNNDLTKAIYETMISAVMRAKLPIFLRTGYISAVLDSDLIIDFSGDIWGDNADLLGKHRFIVGLFKDLTAHLLGKKIAMIAGSPGPFSGFIKKKFAKYVFGKFDLVTNREKISTNLLQRARFPTTHVYSLACPAFLFERTPEEDMQEIFKKEDLQNDSEPKVGFIICGWNMVKGPFGRWPREDSEYDIFSEAIEFMITEFNAKVYLLSHNNGFIPPPKFKITQGRDHLILHQLLRNLSQRGIASNYKNLAGIYNTAETKAIIGKMDMLVTGRIHAAVSGFTQYIPTVIIDYGHKPKAHKLKGFAELLGMGEYIADPSDSSDILGKINKCWINREQIKKQLVNKIPKVKKKARKNFDLLNRLMTSEG